MEYKTLTGLLEFSIYCTVHVQCDTEIHVSADVTVTILVLSTLKASVATVRKGSRRIRRGSESQERAVKYALVLLTQED